MSELYKINKTTLQDIGAALKDIKNTDDSVRVDAISDNIRGLKGTATSDKVFAGETYLGANGVSQGTFTIEEELTEQGAALSEIEEMLEAKLGNVVIKKENKLNQLLTKTLTEVTAEDLQGATYIHTYVFASQNNLVSVEIPDTVENIIRYAFSNCQNLNNVVVQGNTLRSIGNYAFQNCKALTNITVPSSFAGFESYCLDGCGNLKTVTILAETPPTLSSGAFNGCNNLSEIFVPADSVEAYKAATNWSAYADKIFAIEEE